MSLNASAVFNPRYTFFPYSHSLHPSLNPPTSPLGSRHSWTSESHLSWNTGSGRTTSSAGGLQCLTPTFTVALARREFLFPTWPLSASTSTHTPHPSRLSLSARISPRPSPPPPPSTTDLQIVTLSFGNACASSPLVRVLNCLLVVRWDGYMIMDLSGCWIEAWL